MSRAVDIDVFRGLTILEMENTESCDHPFFDHASYDEMKLNYADTLFPSFAFISGLLMKPHSVVPVKRNLQLIGLGMAFNSIPLILENEKFRPLGVLQRHGLSSIILNNFVPIGIRNSILFPILMTTIWQSISIGFATNRQTPFKDQKDTAQQKLDSPFFKGRTYHENFDPEGLLGSLMTAVTIWSGFWFKQQNFSKLVSLLIGSGSIASGLLLSKLSPTIFPISKPLWTPTFVLVSNGWSILKLLAVEVLIPYLPHAVKSVLAITGKQSMEVYFVGEILLLALKLGKGESIWSKIETKLTQWIPVNSAKAVMTLFFDATLIGVAIFCHNNNLKIRFI